MWQKAKIISRTFQPESERGQTIWIECRQPEIATIYGEVLPDPDGHLYRRDRNVTAAWLRTNITFGGVQLRILKDDVELLSEFFDSISWENLEERYHNATISM